MTSRRILAVGLAFFLALFVITALVAPGHIEDRLERDAVDALESRSLPQVVLEADGRRLVVSSRAGAAVVAVLEGIDGVRDVTRSKAIAAPTSTIAPTTSQAPGTTSVPLPTASSTVPTTTLPPTTTTAAPTTTESPPTTTTATTTTAPPTFEEQLVAALGSVEFESDDPDEPTAASKLNLDAVADLLASQPKARISVTGHVAHGSSDAGDDQGLSLARAWAVAGYLEWRGVAFERIDVVGAGSQSPLAGVEPADTTNERIEIRVLEGA